MKIGIVTTWFERGAAIVSRAYRDCLVNAGHEVFIFARGGEFKARTDPYWNDSHVTWCNPVWNESGSNFDFNQFLKWVQATNLDLIIFNEQNYWPVIVKARRALDIPLVAYVDYYTEETVPYFALYDALLCNTKRHHSVFSWHKEAWYIPWGTDCQLYNASSEPVEAGYIYFFHSAGMNPFRKGTYKAIEAFLRLKGPCRFLLHIQMPETQCPHLMALCTQDPRIEIVNETVSAPGLYHRGDVLVYPTELEGIGLSMAEALASSMPVITTDSPPMNEFVQQGVNGWLVKPKEYRGRSDGYYWALSVCDSQDVYQAMKTVMENISQLPQWKRAARAYALEHLDWKKNSRAVPAMLEQLASRKLNRNNVPQIETKVFDLATLPVVRGGCRIILNQLGLQHTRVGNWLIHG